MSDIGLAAYSVHLEQIHSRIQIKIKKLAKQLCCRYLFALR